MKIDNVEEHDYTCPECEGHNTTEDGETCFDCAVADYADSYSLGDYYIIDARQE